MWPKCQEANVDDAWLSCCYVWVQQPDANKIFWGGKNAQNILGRAPARHPRASFSQVKHTSSLWGLKSSTWSLRSQVRFPAVGSRSQAFTGPSPEPTASSVAIQTDFRVFPCIALNTTVGIWRLVFSMTLQFVMTEHFPPALNLKMETRKWKRQPYGRSTYHIRRVLGSPVFLPRRRYRNKAMYQETFKKKTKKIKRNDCHSDTWQTSSSMTPYMLD